MTSSIIIVCMVLGASALRGIVFVMLDDAGASDISFNAKLNNVTARIPTSSIDRLADEGVKLSRNYVHMVTRNKLSTVITEYRYVPRPVQPLLRRVIIPVLVIHSPQLKVLGVLNLTSAHLSRI